MKRYLPIFLFSHLLWTAAAAENAAPRETVNFDGQWLFQLGDSRSNQQADLADGAWRPVDLPHDWSAEGDFNSTNASGTAFLPGGIGWYRKHFSLPKEAPEGRWVIRFDGIFRDSDIWLNGVHLGRRPSGYATFEYDLTPHLQKKENVLAVRVERENTADSRWYPGSGICRHVWLTRAPMVQVESWGVQITTPRVGEDDADVVAATTVTNGLPGKFTLAIVNRICDEAGKVQADGSSAVVELKAGESKTVAEWQKLPRPKLWSPEHPTLYRMVTQLKLGDQIIDEVVSSFGVRTFYFDPAKGLVLNGTNRIIKGLCLHDDAGVVGVAVPDEVLERRLRLIKAMGADGVRASHNPHAPEFYDLCDRIGLLVMDEAFDEWEIGKRKWVAGRNEGVAARFGYSSAFAEWGLRDLGDMVRQHRNHPSIVLWSIGNEIDYPSDPYVHPESRVDPDFAKFSQRGLPDVAQLTVLAPKLIAEVKRFDATRPVTMALANVPAANGIGLADLFEVAGYNYQNECYGPDRLNFPHRSIVASESGKAVRDWNLIRQRGDIAGTFLWTGFDFLGEAGVWPNHGSTAGLFDTCGFLKPEGFLYEALWKTEPVVRLVTARGREIDHPGRLNFLRSWTWNASAEEKIRVAAFGNCDEIELFLDGRSLGAARLGEDLRAEWDVAFAPGELSAVGRRDGRQVAQDALQTAGPAEKIVFAFETPLPGGKNPVAQVTLRVVDAQGVTVPDFKTPVTVSVHGAAKILGVDNGDLNDSTPLSSRTRRPRHGQLFAVIRTAENAGEVFLEAVAPGLAPSRIRIPTGKN